MTTLPRPFVPDAPPGLPNAGRTGLTVFMAVATTLFSLLLFAYAMRMREPDWQPIPHPVLWWNTGALALASIAMQRARRIGPYRTMWLVAGGVLAAVFVIGQLVAWQMLSAAGETVTVNPSNSFLYLLTGLHGLHVLGGLAAWRDDRATPARGPVPPNGPSRARYWHFLLAVWLVLLAAMQWLTPGSSPPSAGRYTEPRHDRADGPHRIRCRIVRGAARRRAARRLARHRHRLVVRPRSLQGAVGKAMMWIFLLSDTFVFSSFLIGYMTVRMSTTAPWPDTAKVFASVAAWKCRCC